jgi:hypothetical protein
MQKPSTARILRYFILVPLPRAVKRVFSECLCPLRFSTLGMIRARGVPNDALAVQPAKVSIISNMHYATLTVAFAVCRGDGGFRAGLVVFSHQRLRSPRASSLPLS